MVRPSLPGVCLVALLLLTCGPATAGEEPTPGEAPTAEQPTAEQSTPEQAPPDEPPTPDEPPGIWSRGGQCLGGVCTGEPLAAPADWKLEATEGQQVIHRAKEPPSPLADLGAGVDSRTGRVAVVLAVLKGRGPCQAARDQLTELVGEPHEISRDWWSWDGGQSLRIRETIRLGDRVLMGACTLDRMDPRFDDREGTWTE